jgi:hypothetical protein
MSYLRNTWYQAAWSTELEAGELFHCRMLSSTGAHLHTGVRDHDSDLTSLNQRGPDVSRP